MFHIHIAGDSAAGADNSAAHELSMSLPHPEMLGNKTSYFAN
jgi:hypothetical protein